MRKGVLQTGDNMLVLNTKHYVTLRVFTNALAEHFYNRNEDFPEKLTKKEAEKILRRRLFFHGIEGEYEVGYFESSFENGEKFNKIFDSAKTFVRNKYSHLNIMLIRERTNTVIHCIENKWDYEDLVKSEICTKLFETYNEEEVELILDDIWDMVEEYKTFGRKDFIAKYDELSREEELKEPSIIQKKSFTNNR